MIDRWFTNRGVRLHVTDHGGDGRPVVLLHGGSAHSRWWDFVVPHLGSVHAYALDLRGHGDSGEATAAQYSIADYASDVGALIAHFALERPVLVGHSLGSFVALRHAVDHPGAPSAVVLVDGRASFGESGSRYMRLLGMLGAAEYPTLEEAIAKFRTLPKQTIAAPEILRHVARHGFREQGGRWSTKFDRASLGSHEPFDLRPRLGELEIPVVVIRGEHSTVLRAEHARALAAACRDGSLIELPGCHHHLLIDRPDLLGQAIRGLLRRLDDRVERRGEVFDRVRE